jgi:hypothetical protein
MPNSIKYNVSAETLALKKGNFYIGTGDVGKGPTSSTGYYNGITPPSGGYTIYLNKETGGPSIYVASNDSQLISLTNLIAGTSYNTTNDCFNYFLNQSDKMCINRDYENIITDGLTDLYDVGFVSSYPKNGINWYNLTLNGITGILYNGVSYISDGGGSFTCDGSDDYVTTNITIEAATNLNLQTLGIWLKGGFIEGVGVYGNNSFTGSDADESGKFHLIIAYQNATQIWFAQSWYGGSSEQNYYATITPQSWNYLTMVKKSVETYDVYYNGVLVMENCVRIANKSSKFNLGRWWNGQPVRSLGTPIVQNYNRALSVSEVVQNYNAQKGRFGL